MTVTAPRQGSSLFHSEWGLLDFQAEGLAQLYFSIDEEFSADGGALCVFDTGVGKSVVGLALAAVLFEDDKIDLVILPAEKNKLDEWVSDTMKFTELTPLKYHGPNRKKTLLKKGCPQVLVSTYETFKADLVTFAVPPGRKLKQPGDGYLFDELRLRDKRILMLPDEVMKLKGRGTQTHKAFEYTVKELRKLRHQRLVGLTGTPIDRDLEDTFNVGRIVVPSRMPTVAEFERRFTRGKDHHGNYRIRSDRKPEFAALFNGVMVAKSKFDPDVITQFPKQIEETVYIDFEAEHRALYEAVIDLIDPDAPGISGREAAAREAALFSRLRMTAGHPASHIHASSKWSKAIVDALGADFLRAIPNSKGIDLINRLTPLIKGQGAQCAVFTHYGRTVLPELVRNLRDADFTVAEYHGGQHERFNERAKQAFLAGDAEILMLSDAGARGINLRNIQYVTEYESATSYSMRTQRINRIHRIDATIPSVTATTQVLRGSIEDDLINLMLARNFDHDLLVGEGEGEDFLSAGDRRSMIRAARERRAA